MTLAAQREAIRRWGLFEFQKTFWDEIDASPLSPDPHIALMCRHLEACAVRGTSALPRDVTGARWLETCPAPISDLVIAVPPGSSKSTTCSIMFPAWVWSWCPSARFITLAYAEDLALDFGRRAFELMRSERYQEMFPHVEILDGDRAAMSDYRTSAKGRRWSMPMGGKVTGKHAHFLLSDDPAKPDDLKHGGESAKAALALVRHRWDNLFSNRSAHPQTFTRIIIAQRLHEEDLSGHAVQQGAVHLRLPMEFEPHDAYTSPWGNDERTQAGEPLIPARFPPSVIESRKAITSARDYAAQYQQRPSPEDGSIFNAEWFKRLYEGMPWNTSSPMTLSVDASLKESSGADFTVLQVWAKHNQNYYLVDQVRQRMGFSQQVTAIKALRHKWPQVRNVVIEDKANGTAIVDALKRVMPGVIAVSPEGGKVSRASATEWLWMAGNVFLPKNEPWAEDFINEHLMFPAGRHDDMVDCCSQALNWWSARDRASLFKKAMANVGQMHNSLAHRLGINL